MLKTNIAPFPDLFTERLLLRKIIDSDAPRILYLRSHDLVMKYLARNPLSNLEEALKWIKIIHEAQDTDNGITWAICLMEEPEMLIGNIGYWRLSHENFRAEIGYMLDPEFWRKGIMKEAIAKVISFGFEQLGLHSIEADIDPENLASELTLVSSGFINEAYFKENLFFNGEFKDSKIFSLLNPVH